VRRLLTVLGLLAASAAAGAQSSSADAAKLQKLRAMSPEQRAVLSKRLAELKALPAEEKVRMKDNLGKIKAMPPEQVKKLREKVQRITPEESKRYTELASGFFRWAQRMGVAEGFPRGQFFVWLKNERPQEIEEIRAMEPGPGSPRIDRFLKLTHEFKQVVLSRAEQASKNPRSGVEPEVLRELREAAPREFWPRWQELQKSLQARRANPGPVAPLPEQKRK
jgi:hypothetical protein